MQSRHVDEHRETLFWVLCCLAARGLFLSTHDGSYIDEYLHIFAGRDLLRTGELPSFYVGESYDRGLLISAMCGALLAAFGDHIWVAKLCPLLLGTISFALFHRLCMRIWPVRADVRTAACTLVLLNPWTVFNHFYIRMYVIYEAGLLLLLWMLAGLLDALHTTPPQRAAGATTDAPAGRFRDARRWLVRIVATCVLLWLGTRDSGVLPVIACAAGGLMYALVTAPERRTGAPPSVRALLSRTAACGAFGAGLLATPPGRRALRFWLAGELRFTSSGDHKFVQLFFEQQLPLTLLFGAGLFAMWRCPAGPARTTLHVRRLTGLVAAGLLAAHLVSSRDLQITRGVLYLMPLYFGVAAGALSLWPARSADRLARHVRGSPTGRRPARAMTATGLVVATCLGTGAAAANYPDGFVDEPGIPSEISYIGYARAYRAVAQTCQGARLVDASPSAHIGLFYGVRPDLAVAPLDHSRQDLMVHGNEHGLATVYGEIPVSRTLSLRTITDNGGHLNGPERPDCLLVRRPSAGRIVPKPVRKALRKERPVASSENIDLYRMIGGRLRARHARSPADR